MYYCMYVIKLANFVVHIYFKHIISVCNHITAKKRKVVLTQFGYTSVSYLFFIIKYSGVSLPALHFKFSRTLVNSVFSRVLILEGKNLGIA